MYRFKFLAIILLLSIIFNLTSVGAAPVRAEEDGSSPEIPEEITEPPVITTVFPNYGSSGKTIYVLGDNFVENETQVWLGDQEVEDLIIISENRLSFTVPAKTNGDVVSLVIKNSSGMAELQNAFTYGTDAEPEVNSITPNTGGIKGGTPVTIKGSNFRQGVDSNSNPIPPEVKFGDELASSVTVINTGEIIAIAPPAVTEGEVKIYVKNPKQDDWTETGLDYEYISEGKAIRILNITPNRGTMYGGTPITIRGVNFPTDESDYSDDKDLKILIGDVEVSEIEIKAYGYKDENGNFIPYKDENGNEIYIINGVTGPSQFSGPQDVKLNITWAQNHEKEGRTEIAVLEDGFTYYNPETYPEIYDVINTVTGTNEGPIGGGHKIEIKGSSFESGAEVYFGTVQAEEVIKVTNTLITVKLPPGEIAGPVDVIVYNKNEGQVTGQAIKPGGFTYRGTSMKISSVTPNYTTTEERKKVYITGENFDEDIENTRVYFEYVVTDPVTEEETVYQEPFEYVKLASGEGTLLTAWTPNRPASGWKDLVVENSFGRAVLPNAFEVRSPDIEPEIEFVLTLDSEDDNLQSPKGPSTGGTRFKIIGKNFDSHAKVYVGDNLATDVDVISFTEIEATSPPGEPGWHSVTVESITGNKATLPANAEEDPGKQGFYYYSNPEIVDVSPSRGSVDGGNIITITGEQFYPGLTVNFGFENEDGSFTPVASVTEEVDGENEIRLVDNETIQLRLPELQIDILTEEQTEELEKNGELAVQVQVVNNDQRSTVWSKTFLYKIPDSENKIEIYTVTPAIGRVEGGPQVVIRGENFHPDATVHFGWEKAEIISLTVQEIIVTAPPNPEGEYKVTVSNHFDTGTAIWEPFEYFDPESIPQIEEVFPPMGPVEGGTKITITGVGFWPGGAQVWIGGKLAGNVEANYTYITATTPEGDKAGPADVMVVNPDGGTDILPGGFTYRIPDSDPEISSVSPNQVPTTGGTIVTIKGEDFRKGVTVYFGTEVAEIVHFIEPDEIVVKAPAYPPEIEATVDVTVLNRDGGVAQLENGIEYVVPRSEPIIDSIDPDKGPAAGDTLVVINGDGFSSKGVTVYFGGHKAQVQSIRYDRLEVITPPGEPGETVHVTVTNHDPEVLGSYTLENAYTYIASQPVIESVAPNQGTYLGGTLVTITGEGFTTARAEVYIGEWQGKNVKVLDSETITFVTRPIADRPEDLPELKWWDVKVVNADGVEAVKEEAFRYLFPDSNPVITRIEPDTGPTVGGLPVTIYGTDFRERAQVVIGGKDAEVLFIDDTSGEGNARIIAKLPPHTPGEKDVVVINYEGAISNTVTFTYVPPLSFPEIDRVEPGEGPTLGDTEVLITGIGFKEGEAGESPRVWFGMNEAPEVEFVDYKTLRVITPPGNEGNVDVLVLNPDMGQSVLTNGFRYIEVEAPVVDSVVPHEGTAEGGTEITITGGPFDQEAVVLVGGNPALEVVVEDAGTITAITPPGEVGWQEVRVKNPDGGWGALANGFYYFKPRSAPEEPPQWLDAHRKDKTTIELRWEPVEFANYYEIWLSNTRYGEYRFLDQTERTVYYASGLDYNETYYFQIRAVNELGVSDFSYYESVRTGSGRLQETDLVPEKMIWEAANGNVTATIATADALAYTGYRIDFSQGSSGQVTRRVVRISREALTGTYWPITVEAPGITLSLPVGSIEFITLASKDDYAEIIINDLGQQVAEKALRNLPRGSRIISPIYEVSGQVVNGITKIPLGSFKQQVELTLKYSTTVTPGNQVSLYTFNPSTGTWVNTGAAGDAAEAQLTLGIGEPGWFMLVEHR